MRLITCITLIIATTVILLNFNPSGVNGTSDQEFGKYWKKLIQPDPTKCLRVIYSYCHNIVRDILRYLQFLIGRPYSSEGLDLTYSLKQETASTVVAELESEVQHFRSGNDENAHKNELVKKLKSVVEHINDIEKALSANFDKKAKLEPITVYMKRIDEGTPWILPFYEWTVAMVKLIEQRIEKLLEKFLLQMFMELEENNIEMSFLCSRDNGIWTTIAQTLRKWNSLTKKVYEHYEGMSIDLYNVRRELQEITVTHVETFQEQAINSMIPKGTAAWPPTFEDCKKFYELYLSQLAEMSQIIPEEERILNLMGLRVHFKSCINGDNTSSNRQKALSGKRIITHNYLSGIGTEITDTMTPSQAYSIVEKEQEKAKKFVSGMQNPLMFALGIRGVKYSQQGELKYCYTTLLDGVREILFWGLQFTVKNAKDRIEIIEKEGVTVENAPEQGEEVKLYNVAESLDVTKILKTAEQAKTEVDKESKRKRLTRNLACPIVSLFEKLKKIS
ncbi:hypothetical protein DdX_11312 [Ditylenchus destructor]|uniref:Uncharacterized protein n=1 Tax=Ditylenchus destructor TaxID=166010 RepID=A0AAD4MXT2_9BILA|nr:hypothetical protein DdX_11312 [Ditylenchus destructor]